MTYLDALPYAAAVTPTLGTMINSEPERAAMRSQIDCIHTLLTPFDRARPCAWESLTAGAALLAWDRMVRLSRLSRTDPTMRTSLEYGRAMLVCDELGMPMP
jgi:hypothetical protein